MYIIKRISEPHFIDSSSFITNVGPPGASRIIMRGEYYSICSLESKQSQENKICYIDLKRLFSIKRMTSKRKKIIKSKYTLWSSVLIGCNVEIDYINKVNTVIRNTAKQNSVLESEQNYPTINQASYIKLNKLVKTKLSFS